MPPPPKQRKIALMGFRSVGKSSLAIQFVEGQFVDCYDPTIENTFNKKCSIKGRDYELMLVDTAGQDEHTIFPSEYAVDIHGYVFVYSIDSFKSYEVCQTIHDKLVDLVGAHSKPIILVGNKSDLQDDRRVTHEDGLKLAEHMQAVFLETSAKTNTNVNDVFTRVLSAIESRPDVTGENGACSMM